MTVSFLKKRQQRRLLAGIAGSGIYMIVYWLIAATGAGSEKIGTAARRDIEEMTGTKVFLKLFVKVRRNWRDNEKDVRSFGYDRKSL